MRSMKKAGAAMARAGAMGVFAMVGLAGCGVPPRTSFVPTDANVALSPRGRAPEVYLDRKPTTAYRPVGIIEVIGGWDLSAIIAAATRRGEEIGCDLLVDRAMGAGRIPDRRWIARAEGESSGDRARPAGAGALLGDFAPAPTTVFVPVEPMTRREFVCGVYETTIAADHGLTDRAHAAAAAASPEAIWSVWEKANGAAACPSAQKALAGDAECAGASCRAALVLSKGFIHACSPDAEALTSVYGLRHRWEKEAPEDRVSACFEELTAMMQQPATAAGKAADCKGESGVEHALREAVRKPGAR